MPYTKSQVNQQFYASEIHDLNILEMLIDNLNSIGTYRLLSWEMIKLRSVGSFHFSGRGNKNKIFLN